MREAPAPRLKEALRSAFDGWLSAATQRFASELRFSEIRKGVRSLSALYVERRSGADLAARAREGAGKRAALATYFAPLHFLAAHCTIESLLRDADGELVALGRCTFVERGAGTGSAGRADT